MLVFVGVAHGFPLEWGMEMRVGLGLVVVTVLLTQDEM